MNLSAKLRKNTGGMRKEKETKKKRKKGEEIQVLKKKER